jgi:hypothetical protein
MVSIAAKTVMELPSDTPRFPAVVGTRNNRKFTERSGPFLGAWRALYHLRTAMTTERDDDNCLDRAGR